MSRAAALLAFLLLAAGCSGPGPGGAGTSGPSAPALDLHESATLPARGQQAAFHEVNLRMAANATLHYRWDAAANITFNVHSHAGGQVVTHVRHFGAAHEGNFTAPAAGGYSLMWENFGPQPVALRYDLTGAAEVDSH